MCALGVGPRQTAVPADGLTKENRGGQRVAEAFQASAPPEIVGEILGRNAAEAGHPALEAAVVGIDVLDVEGVIDDPNPRAEIDGLLGDMGLGGEGTVDRGTVGTQHGIGVEDRGEHGAYALGGGLRKHRIGGVAATVTHDQYRDLFVGQTGLRRHPPAFSGRAREMPLPVMSPRKTAGSSRLRLEGSSVFSWTITTTR